MKLKIAIALFLCVVSGIVFTGCGNSDDKGAPPSTNAAPPMPSTNK